ncbi:MAG: hypothetical protein Kow0077_09980 [Anaerolineae bacterium]
MLTWLRDDTSLRKRDLGILVLIAGAALTLGLLVLDPVAEVLHRAGVDLLSPDREPGFGPMQRLALLAGVMLLLLGLTLLPLRQRVGVPPAVDAPQAQTVVIPRWVLWGIRGLLWIVLAVFVFYLIIYLVYGFHIIQFPFDYDQGEGFELVDTIMFSQFRWPYQNTEVYPFYSSNYPPLFHIIAAPFVWVFGPAYWYGRLLAFLGTLVTAGAIGYAVFRAERNRLIAILSGLAFLASNYIYHVGPLFRQHFFMVMFETLAVVVLAPLFEIQDARQRRRVLLVGLALVMAAGYTKQHAVFTAIAVFAFLFINSPRRALGWGILFAAVGGAIFLAIDRATGGQWWLNIITANVNPFVPGQFGGLFRQWFGLHGALVTMAALLVVYEVYFDRISLYSIWFVAALLSTTLAGKWGAGDSYFATTIAAACILSGIFAARMLNGGWQWPADHYLVRLGRRLFGRAGRWRDLSAGVARVAVAVAYVLYALAVFHMPTQGAVFGSLSRLLNIAPNTEFAFYDSAGWTVGYAVIGQIPTEQEIANGWELVRIAAEADGPVMTEDASFSLLAGKDVVGNPTQLRNLYNNGLYDPSALVEMVEGQAFGVIILRALFYPDPVLYAMMQAYDVQDVIPMNGFEYQVLYPDPTWPDRKPARDALWAWEADRTLGVTFVPPAEGAAMWLEETLNQAGWEGVTDWRDNRLLMARDAVQIEVVLSPPTASDGLANAELRVRQG